MEEAGKSRIPSLIMMKKIFEGTSEHTGREFFRNLVRELAEVLGVHGVWVTEFKEKEYRLNSLAFWLAGDFVEKYEYDIKGTPCEPVVEGNQICHVPERVIELYPDDPDLPPLGAVSYMGLALRDTDDQLLGHLAMLDNKPMEEIPEVFFIFKLFASRAAAEMRRVQYERRLKESEGKINRLFNGTMDAIIELNADLHITQANEAAIQTFQTARTAFIGKPIHQFLEKEAFQKLLDTLPFLESAQQQPSSLWIQGYLYCRNARKEVFPADATMSCYPFENRVFYALYIRDVHDRIDKEAAIKKLTAETVVLQEKIAAQQMSNILGESPALKRTLLQINQVAPTDSTVLILGETGTGKELIAREIHQQSRRKAKPYITLNCAALPAELIESELFGHVKGAYTGASDARDGRFMLADGGTLFLDEIGELPLALQAKLLRVIQEGEFEPVGSSFTQKVNVRIIAATHRNLKEEVTQQRFREDLYYRLNVFPVEAPPLRERGNDVLLLAQAFLHKYAERHSRKVVELSDADKAKLLHYPWPGNVRELQNIMERAVITGQQSQVFLSLASADAPDETQTLNNPARILTNDELEQMEIKNLVLALKMTKGKIFGEGGAAQLIGIPPTTFSSKLKKYGIQPKAIL